MKIKRYLESISKQIVKYEEMCSNTAKDSAVLLTKRKL